MEDKKIGNNSLAGNLLNGAFWAIGIRWVSKFLGIISLAICARILSPEDYGLITMAMVVVGFVSLVLELGLETALIKSQNTTPELYNSAWSIRIIQRSTLAFIVIASAPLAANFYNDSRITLIMIAVGIAEFVCAFENIYSVNLRKFMNFRSDFLYIVIPRITSFSAAVTSVIILESYWGLVIGICVTEVSRTLLSYFIVKERPRWSLNRWRDLAGFSGWFMARGLADFIVAESDRLILGVLGGARTTGIFSVAKEVSTLPSSEIVLPICRALTPTLSTISGDPARLSAAIGKSLSGTMLIAAPVALGFALISNEFVLLLFGPKWTDSTPILSILCIGGVAYAFREISANALVITGNIRTTVILSWANASILIILFYPIYKIFDLIGIAWLIVFSAFLTASVYAFILSKLNIASDKSLLSGLLRPIASAAIMYLITSYIFHNIINFNTITNLGLKIFSGAIVYLSTITTLWLAAGKPNSSEAILFNEALKRIKQIAQINK